MTAVAAQGQDLLVNLQDVFGLPPDPALLLPDGLHPSLAGQTAIVRAVVETLTARV
jgi:lysophospholipase L1-like esterase